MRSLFEFCASLDARNVRYDLAIERDDAVMVRLVVPGQYLEVEFFQDGSIEIEHFESQGVDAASDQDLDEVLSFFGSD